MNEEDRDYVLQAFASVFEGFAFMFVDEDGDDSGGDADAFYGAVIGFEGKGLSGELEVLLPAAMCTELAQNILGEEEDELPDNAATGALAEVLNVACGYLLAQKHGDDHVFDLSIPATRAVDREEWGRLSADDRYLFFAVDESPVLARLSETAS